MTSDPLNASPHNDPAAPGHRNRKLMVVIVLGLIVAAAMVAFRSSFMPRPIPLWSLLPGEGEIYLYADLQALQNNPAVRWYLHDGPGIPGAGSGDDQQNETRRFVEATGFRYQDHLHQVAAMRRSDNWEGFANVSIDRPRFESYLKSRATATAQIASTVVYTFGHVRPLKLALISDTLLVFSVGAGEDRLAELLLMLAQRPTREQALATLSRNMPSDNAARWKAVLDRPLWAFAKGAEVFGTGDPNAAPSLGGFMLGEDTLGGVETILFSAESSLVTLHLQGELLCRQGVNPQPLENNLKVLASLLRPRAPEPGGKDYRPVWDALSISSQDSEVLIGWQPSAAMLSTLTGGAK